jgi:amidophosphoribosyltransferase
MHTIEAIEREPVLDHCGVVGLFSTYPMEFFTTGLAGLKALQTRGQDGAGFCALSTEGPIVNYKGEGMIREVFIDEIVEEFRRTKARIFGFQTRYGTNGAFHPENTQPFSEQHEQSGEPFFVAHNGQFSEKPGDTDTQTSDSAKFVRSLARTHGDTWETRIRAALSAEHGAWSLIIGTRDALFLARDPRGIRPLLFGSYNDADTGARVWAAASETAALRAMGVTTFYNVMPGEMIRIDDDGVHTFSDTTNMDSAGCSFEGIYIEDGRSELQVPTRSREQINVPIVNEFRRTCGRILAQEAPISPDTIDFAIGIPGTGITGGRAYAEALGIPYFQAITDHIPQDNPRTFMTANLPVILDRVLHHHFDFDTNALRDKRVVLIDDSIVRGNIMTGLVRLLKKQYGVASVHIRILSPMIDKGCHLGVNTRTEEELIAWREHDNVERIKNVLGADSLAYLSPDGLKRAFGNNADGYCYGCMVGHHPPIDRMGNPME